MSEKTDFAPGFTFRSVAASLCAILLLSIIVQHIGVTDEWAIWLGGEALGIPGMMTFMVVFLFFGVVFSLFKFKLLTREEMFVVLFSLLIATPLMNASFWRYMLAVTNEIPRKSQFERYDAFSEKMWPHGPNLLEKGFAETGCDVRGNAEFHEADTGDGKVFPGVTLANTEPDQVSAVNISVPVFSGESEGIRPGQPYFISVLARSTDLGPESYYYCRVYYDESTEFNQEAFSSSRKAKKTFLQKEGFVRAGIYGLAFPSDLKHKAVMEYGLVGPGTLTFTDPDLINVDTLETAFTGKRIIKQSDYEKLPPIERQGLLVRPDSLFSIQGIRYIVFGYIPLREWVRPLTVWIILLACIMSATFAMAVIMRRQWIENERYPLPFARVSLALLDRDEDKPFAGIWKNPYMWAGFGVALFWSMMKGWRAFNPSVPDLNISVSLKQYFSDPGWGGTWNRVTFTVTALFLSLGLLMELNILLSIVVGYFLFRFQFWFGEAYGLSSNRAYPFGDHQMIGAYVTYSVLILFFTRKYLWSVIKKAVKGGNEEGEAVSYRTAFIILGTSFVGVILWAVWMDLPVMPMIVFFLFMLSICLVAAKLRAECGIPHYSFAPNSAIALLIIPLVGGMAFFLPKGIIFLTLVTVVFCSQAFFHLPGLQVELIEVGRRMNVKPRHIGMTLALGLSGGIILGGWVYLSSAYAIGADKYPIATGQFASEGHYKTFNTEMIQATDDYFAKEGDTRKEKDTDPAVYGLIFAAVVTTVLTVLRQFFAGFFFHPIGYILGMSGMASGVWGSLLTAWGIRFLVLKLGGAATVRNKLIPFAIGMFMAVVAGYLIFTILNTSLYFFNPGIFKPRLYF